MSGNADETKQERADRNRRLLAAIEDVAAHGNISRAASELGLTRASMYRRIEKFGL